MTPADDTSDAEQRAERLADQVERLGLVDHLTEAGLPSLRRGADGRPEWTDPATGRALEADQLEDLDRLLHSEGAEPEHAVPVALLLLARQARLREELLASAWFDYPGLAEVRGASVNATRFAVHKAASEHRLLVVPADGASIVPAFQLTPAGELRPELTAVLEPLLAAGTDPWRAWGWLTRPVALLGGLVPEEVAREDADLVRHAATRLAARVAGA